MLFVPLFIPIHHHFAITK